MSLKSFQKKFGRFLKCFWRVSEGVDMRSGWFNMVLIWYVRKEPKVFKCSKRFKYYISRFKIKIRAYVILGHF